MLVMLQVTDPVERDHTMRFEKVGITVGWLSPREFH